MFSSRDARSSVRPSIRSSVSSSFWRRQSVSDVKCWLDELCKYGNFGFRTENSTINNAIDFQNFPIKFCTLIGKLFSIMSCQFCLNRLRCSYFIMKRAGCSLPSDTLANSRGVCVLWQWPITWWHALRASIQSELLH